MQNASPGKLSVQGSEIAVAKAISLLEEQASVSRKSFHPYAEFHQSVGYYYPQHHNQLHYNANSQLHFAAHPAGYQSSDIVAKGATLVPQSNPNPYERDVSSFQRDNQLRDFALKLGYTSEEIATAIEECSTVVNENSLLQQLTMLYPRRSALGPAQGSIIKTVKDSSSPVDHDERPIDPRANIMPTADGQLQKTDDASTSILRHIVIDGSNVAMR